MQDSFVAAMREWTVQGVPDNPSAWLFTAARNRAIDAIRRERTRQTFGADLAMYLDSESWREGNASGALAILVVEPAELTVVNIVGPIDLAKLAALQGQFGIPPLPSAPGASAPSPPPPPPPQPPPVPGRR